MTIALIISAAVAVGVLKYMYKEENPPVILGRTGTPKKPNYFLLTIPVGV